MSLKFKIGDRVRKVRGPTCLDCEGTVRRVGTLNITVDFDGKLFQFTSTKFVKVKPASPLEKLVMKYIRSELIDV